MPETYEQKRAQSESLFRSNKSASTDETTPASITHVEEIFAQELGGKPQFVPVVEDRYGLYGWCSDGVIEKIKHDGGLIRFGWTIWEWPGIFLTAEFHAVWGSPNGNLVDITPKPQGETRILFVEDTSYSADFDFDLRPINRRFRIPQEPDYMHLAAVEIAAMKPSQLEYEKKRAAKKNIDLLHWVADKQPRPSFPKLVDELIHVCDAVDRKSDELSGKNSHFSPDREYIELMKRKIALMEAARRFVRA